MSSPNDVRATALRHGYRVRGDFILSAEAWWTNYYAPLERRMAGMEWTHPDVVTRIVLAEAREEIDCYRQHADCYGYLFIVLKA